MRFTDPKELVAAAGLSDQKRCRSCDRLLEAYGRQLPAPTDPPNPIVERLRAEVWTCPGCAVPGATRANLYDEKASS